MESVQFNHQYRWLPMMILGAASFAGALAADAVTPPPRGSQSQSVSSGEVADVANEADANTYLDLTSPDIATVNASLTKISKNWHSGSAAMMVEVSRFAKNPLAFSRIIALAEAKTGQRLGADLDHWYRWIWKQKYVPHPQYAEFKSRLYARIDPRFEEYFRVTKDAKIRLDEIRWGGVVRDGIPPLKNPKMLNATQAGFLADTDVVFGVELNGDARCYPKRILAWHEMFKDTIGGESVCGVY